MAKDKKDKKKKKDKGKKEDQATIAKDENIVAQHEGGVLIKRMHDAAGRDNFVIYGARCTYPYLYDPPVYEGKTDKNSIKLIFNDKEARDAALIDALQAVFEEVRGAKWKNEKDWPDQSLWAFTDKNDQFTLSAKSEKAPVVVMPDGKTEAKKESCLIYSGCYVNLRVAVWAQDNKWGKRINCQMISAQFSSDGEALDGKTVSRDDAKQGFDQVDVGEGGLF